jgi:FKBP-type peptidyl-prolyl cis-trans isomerase FkpA
MRSLICALALPLVASCAVSQPTVPVTTASGLVYQSLKDGSGTPPAATDTVKVHYRGTLADGREFDSSYKRGEPAEFPLNRVIRCWTEGVQLMKPGGKARLTCPPAIAYGERGAGGVIPPNATLQFEIELLSVRR